MIDLEGARVDDSGVRDGVVVGRDPAGGGESPAGRSRPLGRAAVRSWAVGADRDAVGAAADRDRLLLRAGASDDRDGDVCAVDGGQAPLGMGVRDVDAGGVGLVASAEVLPDRDDRPGAGRVDRAQADPPAGRGGDARDHTRTDSEGQTGEAVPAAGRADRLDRDRGRRAVADRCGPRRGWRACACPGGTEARDAGRREADSGQGSLAGDGPQAEGVDAHDPQAHRGGQARGARVDRADRPAAGDPRSRKRATPPPPHADARVAAAHRRN